MKSTPDNCDDLTTAPGIYVAMIKPSGRHPTNEENIAFDGWNRSEFFCEGYRAALREFAARISSAGSQPQ